METGALLQQQHRPWPCGEQLRAHRRTARPPLAHLRHVVNEHHGDSLPNNVVEASQKDTSVLRAVDVSTAECTKHVIQDEHVDAISA